RLQDAHGPLRRDSPAALLQDQSGPDQQPAIGDGGRRLGELECGYADLLAKRHRSERRLPPILQFSKPARRLGRELYAGPLTEAEPADILVHVLLPNA